jgi:hypothetical protein
MVGFGATGKKFSERSINVSVLRVINVYWLEWIIIQ